MHFKDDLYEIKTFILVEGTTAICVVLGPDLVDDVFDDEFVVFLVGVL